MLIRDGFLIYAFSQKTSFQIILNGYFVSFCVFRKIYKKTQINFTRNANQLLKKKTLKKNSFLKQIMLYEAINE